jgi:hypothetical protein
MTTPEQELLDTIEKLRQEKFPQLPAELVQRIVEIEREFTDNRSEAFKRITQAVAQHLETQSATVIQAEA